MAAQKYVGYISALKQKAPKTAPKQKNSFDVSLKLFLLPFKV